VAKFITQAVIERAINDRRKRAYDVSDGRVAGLELRVRPLGVNWSMRTMLHGKRTRFDLGPAVAGQDDVGGLSLDTARARAGQVRQMARNHINPEHYLAALATGVSIETHLKIAAERAEAAKPEPPKPPSWTWEQAKEEFLAEVKRTRREDTRRDYRGKLQPAELDCFNGRPVNEITRNEMAAAITAVHKRGAEVMAQGMARVVKRMWNWLSEPARQNQTSVPDGVMAKLKAPDPTRVEHGEEAFDPDDEKGDAPPPLEIGRVLAIARLGCLPERIGLGLELLIGTVQRRRAVTGASRWRFVEHDGGARAWHMPPFFRKTGSKKGKRSHIVPVEGFAARALARLCPLSDFEGGEGWLFPAGKTNRSARRHAEAGLFNDYLDAMPGVNWSPHGVRYAFATYGEEFLGFKPGEAGLILDHLEGADPDNVTSQFYSSDPQIARKREMLQKWVAWCEERTAEAIKLDMALLDRDLMAAEIRRRRYAPKGKAPE
jgi:integrase